MRTIEERAQDFASSGEYSPTLTECYLAGAKEGMRCILEWQNTADNLPDKDVEVLCMIDRKFQTYAVLRYTEVGWWQPLHPQPGVILGGWIAAEKEPFAWRYIGELK